MEINKRKKPKRKKLIIDLIIAFVVALFIDTGNLALDIILLALVLIIIDRIILLSQVLLGQ